MCPYDGFATASNLWQSEPYAGNLKRIGKDWNQELSFLWFTVSPSESCWFLQVPRLPWSLYQKWDRSAWLCTAAIDLRRIFLFFSGIPELHTTDHSGARLQCHCHVCRIKWTSCPWSDVCLCHSEIWIYRSMFYRSDCMDRGNRRGNASIFCNYERLEKRQAEVTGSPTHNPAAHWMMPGRFFNFFIKGRVRISIRILLFHFSCRSWNSRYPI